MFLRVARLFQHPFLSPPLRSLLALGFLSQFNACAGKEANFISSQKRLSGYVRRGVFFARIARMRCQWFCRSAYGIEIACD
jgi:hypothetical protein